MRTLVFAFLMLAATLARAQSLCGLAQPAGFWQRTVVGFSANGQWAVSWDESKDTGVFSVDAAGVQHFTTSRAFCIVVGRKLSFATLGTRLQSIRTAADPQAAFDAAWTNYVKTPLTDPTMAAVMADFRAQACPQLLPFVPQACQ